MLSFVAGMVNVTGVMLLKVLTTNVTGHFAYFAEEIVVRDYAFSVVFLLYIVSFLLGAFFSSLFIEMSSRKKMISAYVLPISLEVMLLLFVALFGASTTHVHLLAFALLFAMGLQNALVTRVSNSVVRTTHLTGLFTDLGIELSQLIFHKSNKLNFDKLRQGIFLKLAIILCFFIGSLTGGFLVFELHFKTLLIAVICLMVAMYYDYFKLRYVYLKRKWANH